MANNEKQLEKLFIEVKKNIQERNKIIASFNSLLDERWDINYNETDDDVLIDTLDYGINSISFEEFKKRMDWYNSEQYKGSYDFYNKK